MSEIEHTRRVGAHAPRRDADDAELRWSELLAQVGGEVAGPLTAAVERLNQLATTGRIDRPSLRALRTEVEGARRAAMIGQQLARYASGRVRQSHERVDLAQAVRDAAAQRGRDADARGLQLRQTLKAAEVVVDPTLLFSLLQSLLDWALELARAPIELRLECKAWPAHARLSVRVVHRPADEVAEPRAAGNVAALDTLPWRLAQQVAWAMGLGVERHDDASETAVALEFPRTVNEQLKGASVIELDSGLSSAFDSKPLAGSHVLVIAARRDMRQRVQETIGSMGLIVDYVASVDEARAFCAGGLPHAIVHAAALGGARFEALQEEIRRDVPEFVFIEITEEGHIFEVSGFNGATRARVGFDAIAASLPSALMFELSKNL
jgi:hypothetical protein